MSEALKAAMEELVPQFASEPRRWEDILRRAQLDREGHDWRRVTAVAIAMLLLVVPAVAIGASVLFREFPRPSDVRGEPVRLGPRETVAAARIGDIHWRLVAFRSDRGLCVGLDFGGRVQASSASCGIHRLVGLVDGPTVDYIGTGANRAWFYGRVAKRVHEVVLVLADGRRLDAATFASPESLALPFNFYVATAPGGVASGQDDKTVRAVLALGENGNVIGREHP
jgi:hypothetical protein